MAYQDSQADGPEPERWKPENVMQPHGYYEPSKDELLGRRSVADMTEAERAAHFYKLLAENATPHSVWWYRLMRFLRAWQ